ncbi:MAG: site-2 protease family protein [Planctomycetota bacterium]
MFVGAVILALFLFSVILHEMAHGYAADFLGDPTARHAGRLTFNPLPHLDWFYSLVMPAMLYWTAGFPFGGLKPVPVNPYNLKNPFRDMMWIALAGPGANVLLALVLRLALLAAPGTGSGVLPAILIAGIYLNLILAAFNLLPIPPLDGSKILMGLLPREQAYALLRLEPFGLVIVLALLLTGWLTPAVEYMFSVMGHFMGI